MAWIKVDQTLFSHRKIIDLAERLDIHEAQAIGHVTALWAWAIDNFPTGVLPDSDRMIARAAMWDGAAGHFMQTLVQSGFIDDDYMGKRELHDWEEWAGALIRKRNVDKERLRNWRNSKRQT